MIFFFLDKWNLFPAIFMVYFLEKEYFLPYSWFWLSSLSLIIHSFSYAPENHILFFLVAVISYTLYMGPFIYSFSFYWWLTRNLNVCLVQNFNLVPYFIFVGTHRCLAVSVHFQLLKAYFSLICVCVTQSCLTLYGPMDYSPTRLLCPWNSPGKNTGVGCHSFLQGKIQEEMATHFLLQGLNPGLLHGRQIAVWATRVQI